MRVVVGMLIKEPFSINFCQVAFVTFVPTPLFCSFCRVCNRMSCKFGKLYAEGRDYGFNGPFLGLLSELSIFSNLVRRKKRARGLHFVEKVLAIIGMSLLKDYISASTQ